MNTIIVEIITKDGISHYFNSDVISVQCSENSKDNELSPTPGFIEQNASIKLYDRNSYFKYNIMKSTESFFQGLILNVYVKRVFRDLYCDEDVIVSEDTICGVPVKENDTIRIGSYFIDKVEMEGDDDIVNITCVDKSIILSNIIMNNYMVETRTVYDFLKIIFNEYLPDSKWQCEHSTKIRCENIRIFNSFVVAKSVREFFDQVCICGMINIYYLNDVYYVIDCYQGESNEAQLRELPVVLKPTYYDQGLQWSLNIKNQIDTFNVVSFSNETEESNILSENVDGFEHDGVSFNLPALPLISNNHRFKEGTETWAMLGKGLTSYYQNGPYRSSKGYAAVLMGTKEFDITIAEPVMQIAGSLSYKGYTKYSTGFDWGDFANPDVGGFHFSDIISIVNNHSPSESSEWTDQSSYVLYATEGINVNPYVKNVHDNSSDTESTSPSADIITKWTGTNHTGNYWWSSSEFDYWDGRRWNDVDAKWGGEPTKAQMWPDRFYDTVWPYKGLTHKEQKINKLRKSKLKVSLDITKTDDYHYHVKLVVPTFYAYIAYTEENYATLYVVIPVENGWVKLDALAFYDVITQITLNLKGYKYNAIENEFSYSLNEYNLPSIDNPINNNIYKISNCNFISETTYIGYGPLMSIWRQYYSQKILNNYKRGRYVVNVDVNAQWCISNNIKINSLLKIKLPDNKYITKMIQENQEQKYILQTGGNVLNKDGKTYLLCRTTYSHSDTVTIITGETAQTVHLFNEISGEMRIVTTYETVRKIVVEAFKATLYTLNEQGEYTEIAELLNSDLDQFYPVKGLGITVDGETIIEGSDSQIAMCFYRGYTVEKVDAYESFAPVVFQVKNITKKFEKTKHVYQLQLIEEGLDTSKIIVNGGPYTSMAVGIEYVLRRPIDFESSSAEYNYNFARIIAEGYSIKVRVRNSETMITSDTYTANEIDIRKNNNTYDIIWADESGTHISSGTYSNNKIITVELLRPLPEISDLSTEYLYRERFFNALSGYIKEV